MPVTATLWVDKDFGGQSFTSDSGQYRYYWNTWGGHNDIFSSMRAWSRGHRGNAYAFEHIDFAGRFAALNVGGGFSSSWWSYFGGAFNDKVSSSLIVAREPAGVETEVALRGVVVPQFASLFDTKTAGKPVSRSGDPRVYATFFPSYDPGKVFATISQDLRTADLSLSLITISGYAARVRYDIQFYVGSDGVLHGYAAWSHVWVESGLLSQQVHDALAPDLHAAKADITSAIESSLALFSRRRFADVYLLPGPPPDMNQFGSFAQYDDDVTLVAVAR